MYAPETILLTYHDQGLSKTSNGLIKYFFRKGKKSEKNPHKLCIIYFSLSMPHIQSCLADCIIRTNGYEKFQPIRMKVFWKSLKK